MKVERGLLIRKQWRDVAVDYVAHGFWFNGVPSYFELLDTTEPLREGRLVELRGADGQTYSCVVLDGREGCAVVALL